MRVWVFMAGSWALVIWCVGNLQHQRPAAMGRKSLIAWQGAAPAGWPPGWHARAVDWRLRGALAWKPTPHPALRAYRCAGGGGAGVRAKARADASASRDQGRQRQDVRLRGRKQARAEEHTTELQSLMRRSYDAFCLKKKYIHK